MPPAEDMPIHFGNGGGDAGVFSGSTSTANQACSQTGIPTRIHYACNDRHANVGQVPRIPMVGLPKGDQTGVAEVGWPLEEGGL